jgi:plastocyanin
MKRIVLTFALVAVAAISAACSTASAQPVASTPAGPAADGPTIVARDMKFAPATVEVKAGSTVTIHFDNQDAAPHNVAIYSDSSASSAISIGDIVSSARKDQVVPALPAGTYFFRCDVHHDMTGTIVAK